MLRPVIWNAHWEKWDQASEDAHYIYWTQAASWYYGSKKKKTRWIETAINISDILWMNIVSFNCCKGGCMSSFGWLRLVLVGCSQFWSEQLSANNKLVVNIFQLYQLWGENASLCKNTNSSIITVRLYITSKNLHL